MSSKLLTRIYFLTLLRKTELNTMKMKLDTLRDAFVNSTSLNTITGNETLGIDNESFLQNKPDVQLQEKL